MSSLAATSKETHILDTLTKLGLNEVIKDSIGGNLDSFVAEAIGIWNKALSWKTSNVAQAHFFAIHLSCLKYSIEFKIETIRKESSLNSQYDTSLIALMKLFNNKYCNSEIVANYYGCPSLKLMIDDVLIRAKEDSAIGAAYEIFLVSKIKTMGTIFEISHLWGQPTKILRQICNDLKIHTKHLKAEDFKILLDEMKHSRAIRSELTRSITNTGKSLSLDMKRNNSPLTKNENYKRSNEVEAKIKNNKNNSINFHPLILFNCSAGGPAFGPIIF